MHKPRASTYITEAHCQIVTTDQLLPALHADGQAGHPDLLFHPKELKTCRSNPISKMPINSNLANINSRTPTNSSLVSNSLDKSLLTNSSSKTRIASNLGRTSQTSLSANFARQPAGPASQSGQYVPLEPQVCSRDGAQSRWQRTSYDKAETGYGVV